MDLTGPPSADADLEELSTCLLKLLADISRTTAEVAQQVRTGQPCSIRLDSLLETPNLLTALAQLEDIDIISRTQNVTPHLLPADTIYWMVRELFCKWLIGESLTLIDASANLTLVLHGTGATPTEQMSAGMQSELQSRLAEIASAHIAAITMVVHYLHASGILRPSEMAAFLAGQRAVHAVQLARVSAEQLLMKRRNAEQQIADMEFGSFVSYTTALANRETIPSLFEVRILSAAVPEMDGTLATRMLSGTETGRRLLADAEEDSSTITTLTKSRKRTSDDAPVRLTARQKEMRNLIVAESRSRNPDVLQIQRTPAAKLVYILMAALHDIRARKSGKLVWLPNVIVGPGGRHVYTHTFYPAMTMRDFVRSRLEMVSRGQMTDLLFSAKGIRGIDQLADLLNDLKNDAVPAYTPDRYSYAFTNGVLNIGTMKFWPYGSDIPRRLLACKLLMMEFPYAHIRLPQWCANRLTAQRHKFLRTLESLRNNGELVQDASEMDSDFEYTVDMLRQPVCGDESTEDLLQTVGRSAVDATEEPDDTGLSEEELGKLYEYYRLVRIRKPGRAGRLIEDSCGIDALSKEECERIIAELRARHRAHRESIAGQAPRMDHIRTWRDIPTPAIDQIFRTQKFAEDEIEFIYYLIGRMLFEPNLYDWQQVAPMLLGAAGTGKSIIIDLIKQMMMQQQVAVLSSNAQEVFGLQTVIGKSAIIIPELDANFRIPQGDIQSLVCAVEPVTANRKGVDTRTFRPRAHVFVAGNRLPANWSDLQGQLSRRFIYIDFRETVDETHYNAMLHEDAMYAQHNFIYKVVSCYLELSSFIGDRNIWQLLPARLQRNKNLLRAEMNEVEHFLQNGSTLITVTRDPNDCMLFSTFCSLLNQHMDSNRMPRNRITREFMETTLKMSKLAILDNVTREVNGVPRVGRFVTGLRAVV